MAQHDSLIGRVIGNYEIQRELGRGGMGVVYKAHEMSLQRVVALKVLPAHLAADEEFVKRFEREARAAARLNHPNIVTVYAVGEQDGMHFMAMEYVKGKTIDTLTKEKGRFEAREALEIIAQAADALAEAHDHDIIHRDIKPQNVMADGVGRVKVMDFGLAKVLSGMSALTATGAAMGTPTYMAPEQCKGEPIDPRTDIYSLGVMLFEMLTGRPPYVGDTPMAVIGQIMMSPFPSISELNPNLPAGVVQIVQKMTAKDPANRYTSGQALVGDIKRWLRSGAAVSPTNDAATVPFGDEATLPLTPTTPASTAQSASGTTGTPSAVMSEAQTVVTPVSTPVSRKRNPTVIAVCALVLCAAIVAGAFFAWRGMSAKQAQVDTASQTAAVGEGIESPPATPPANESTTEAPASTQQDQQAPGTPQGPSTPAVQTPQPPEQNVAETVPSTTEPSAETNAQATVQPEQPIALNDAAQDATQAPAVAPGEAASASPDAAAAAHQAETAPAETAATPSPPETKTPETPTQEPTPEEPAATPSESEPKPKQPETQTLSKEQKLPADKEASDTAPTGEDKPAEEKKALEKTSPKDYADGRFTDRGDGTILDNDTMLIWQKADSGKALGMPRSGRSSDFRHYADELSLAGRAWRIPTKAEFMSLQIDEFEAKDLPFKNSGRQYWCFGSGPDGIYWVFDWSDASFAVSTPDLNAKVHARCVAGP